MTGSTHVGQAPAATAGRTRHHRGRRRVVVIVLVLGVLGVVVVGWLAFRGVQAATSLRAVADGVQGIRTDVAGGRLGDLDARVADVRRDAARADAATSDPVWRVAEALPVVGADAVAVRTVAGAVHGLATGALSPLAEVAGLTDPGALRPVDGRIDLAPIAAAAPAVRTAADSAADARDAVAGLDPAALHGPLVEAVTRLQDQLGSGASALDAAARGTELLPAMLGAQGPRSYLVLFLNSAEVRAQGGIIGAVAVLSADDGRLALTAQASGPDFPKWDEPVLPLTDAELAIASDVIGRGIPNPVIIPDAPRVGQLTAEMWRRTSGQSVDGVLAVDPVALSYVLRATGDVEQAGEASLTADTLVQTLLLDAYREHDEPSESDAYFARVASDAFGALTRGDVQPLRVVQALGQAVDERRFSVWSARPEEQQRILGTPVDGALLSGRHESAVGVFLDNTSGWKTDTFLRTSVGVTSVRCEGDTMTMEVRLDLTSTMPAQPQDLPHYVVGDGSTGVPVGTMRMRVSIYSPVGGTVDGVRRGEAFVGGPVATMADREVEVMTETLAPGATASYHFTVSAPARGPQIPVWTTPTTSGPGIVVAESGCPE